VAAAPNAFAPLAAITRGGLEESWHLGAVAVVEPGGGLIARAGDPRLETFVRSAAKPWQALPLVLAGGIERYQLDEADLALVCASHSGTPAQAARVARLLERGGFGVKALQCGVHPPFDEAAAEALRRRGEAASALHNNCSGKHAGMLLACALLGLSSDDYLDPSHPLQRRVVELVGAFCRVAPAEIGIGIDGCSAPTPRLSLHAAAIGYAALAAPEEASPGADERRAAAAVARAMSRAPEMVAGPGRFTTRLMQVTAGRILGKEGAEGFYAAAVLGPAPLGVAIKVADGGERCRDGVVLDVLRQIGSLSAAEFEELRPFHRPVLQNRRGLRVGEVVPDVELESGPMA